MSQVFLFGRGVGVPPGVAPEVVGSKAWHLMRMAEAGLPVPPGFVLGIGWSPGETAAGDRRQALRAGLAREVRALEAVTGQTFGGGRRPMLLAVRSGAAVSMPGMMDTVLDVGLNDAVVAALRRATGNPRLVWDCYRRLVESLGTVVLGVPASRFAAALVEALGRAGVPDERELDVEALAALVQDELALVQETTGQPFPADPLDQLARAVEAVFASWESERAVVYRRLRGIDGAGGTAVTVQVMVFGNRGGDSGSGVAFTRDPGTGAPGLYLDFLFDAQGEDVVSGRRSASGPGVLARRLPQVHGQLERAARVLEELFEDAQDFEFTVERGELWLLQSRRAKRTPLATLRIAVDLVREGRITPAAALDRLADLDLGAVREERLLPRPGAVRLASGTPASPGVATGPIVLDATAAVACPGAILVRPETATGDLAGMAAAGGVLTAEGSRTAHAAVVARQLGRPCVVGCAALRIDERGGGAEIGGVPLRAGDVITLDGTRGEVWLGECSVDVRRPDDLLAEVKAWRDAAGERALSPPATSGTAG